MKKTIIGLAVFISFASFTPNVHASTLSFTQDQVNSLLSVLSSFNADETTMSAVVMALAQNQTGVVLGASTQTPSCSFTRDLTIGSSGAEVACLQRVLISKGQVLRAGATGYFGPQTMKAVIGLQKALGVRATGYFGPKSRQAFVATLGAPVYGSSDILYAQSVTVPPPPAVDPSAVTSAGAASIAVIVPLGGEIFKVGQTYNISWVGSGIDTVAQIQLWRSTRPDFNGFVADGALTTVGDAIESTIPQTTAQYMPSNPLSSTGTFQWQVNSSSAGYPYNAIKVMGLNSGGSIFGTTGTFSIISATTTQPSVTIISPNGGENYASGQMVPIYFSTNLTDKQSPSGVTLQLYKGLAGSTGASFVQTIVSNWVGGSPYNWQIPSVLPPGQYSVYISALLPSSVTKEGGVYDASNSVFTVLNNVEVPEQGGYASIQVPANYAGLVTAKYMSNLDVIPGQDNLTGYSFNDSVGLKYDTWYRYDSSKCISQYYSTRGDVVTFSMAVQGNALCKQSAVSASPVNESIIEQILDTLAKG